MSIRTAKPLATLERAERAERVERVVELLDSIPSEDREALLAALEVMSRSLACQKLGLMIQELPSLKRAFESLASIESQIARAFATLSASHHRSLGAVTTAKERPNARRPAVRSKRSD